MKSVKIENGEFPIFGSLHGEGDTLLVVAHGFKGFREWGFFPYLGQQLATENRQVLRFDFTHNGVTEETPLDFSRLDLFAENTYGREIQEIKTVVSWAIKNLSAQKTFLLGHSRGGGMVLLAAPDLQVDGVVTLAAIDSVTRFCMDIVEQVKKTGKASVYNGRTQQDMPIHKTILDEVEARPDDFDILAHSKKLNCPCLHIHCEGDMSVFADSSENLAKASGGQLKILPGSDHVFGATHPFVGETEELKEMVRLVKEFIF